DKLYSVVRGATSSVPFGDQQQFFMDLSVRLTPPDVIAIECRGKRVTVGSSRAAKAEFMADGRTRQERLPSGDIINSRIVLDRKALTFTSTGRADDRVNVAFQSLNDGRLSVTRRIYAEQLSQPIIIRTVYDRLSDGVNWDSYGGALVAKASPVISSPAPTASVSTRTRTGSGEADELRRSLDDWIAATNRKDIERQMSFYMPTLQAFYLSRNAPRSAVRSEKQRAFSTARSIDIRAEEPEIVFQDGGQTAVMRFRKQYSIADRLRTRRGEVVQELRWHRTNGGWRIVSERDVKVIR
ncbi:MAG TPA: nuclear transport factor 2 family protein, partial [Pyrinomonadaceae bacterium]|nr:nuclear transport factor 2 family protein [Pyrinomonadaceae bacterium]